MKVPSIKLKQGEQHKIVLPGFSTSGYDWNIKTIDDKIVAISKSVKRVASPKRIVGKSSDEVFQIKALATGKTILLFELKRSWEKTPKEVREFNIIID